MLIHMHTHEHTSHTYSTYGSGPTVSVWNALFDSRIYSLIPHQNAVFFFSFCDIVLVCMKRIDWIALLLINTFIFYLNQIETTKTNRIRFYGSFIFFSSQHSIHEYTKSCRQNICPSNKTSCSLTYNWFGIIWFCCVLFIIIVGSKF